VRDAVIFRAKNETPNSSAKSEWEKNAPWVATGADIFYGRIKAACCCPRFRLRPLLHRFQRAARQIGSAGAATVRLNQGLHELAVHAPNCLPKASVLERMIALRIAGCTCVGRLFGEPARLLIRRPKVFRAHRV
jgi:hypothetical protein